MITGLDHLVVAVSDLGKATDTYAALLGIRPSWHGIHPGQGSANSLFRLANSYVELLAPQGEGALGEFLTRRLESEGEGPLALAFATTDAVAAAAALGARGLSTTDPVEGVGRNDTAGAERRWLSFRIAPEQSRGLHLMVIQHLTAPDALPPSAPVAPVESTVAAVDHVVVMTADPQAAIALFGDALGLRLALDRTFEDRGMRLLFFRTGGVTVECAAPLASSESATLVRPGERAELARSDRFWGVSYRVANIEAARDRVVHQGFDVSEIRTGHKPGTRVCTVRSGTHGVATLLLGPE